MKQTLRTKTYVRADFKLAQTTYKQKCDKCSKPAFYAYTVAKTGKREGRCIKHL